MVLVTAAALAGLIPGPALLPSTRRERSVPNDSLGGCHLLPADLASIWWPLLI
jgi:hypothetical protein